MLLAKMHDEYVILLQLHYFRSRMHKNKTKMKWIHVSLYLVLKMKKMTPGIGRRYALLTVKTGFLWKDANSPEIVALTIIPINVIKPNDGFNMCNLNFYYWHIKSLLISRNIQNEWYQKLRFIRKTTVFATFASVPLCHWYAYIFLYSHVTLINLL